MYTKNCSTHGKPGIVVTCDFLLILLYHCGNISIQAAMNEEAQIPSKPSALVKIHLYRNTSDFETTYLKEVKVVRLPCGGLNLTDLSLLLRSNEIF